ncbi:MAG: SDR family NAD(P)-dependent oxidoreductase, partial [Rhizobacter sp.]|nr:SDR family NAD(P)-dependent oxidoreductase [Rhizobacter sp.]
MKRIVVFGATSAIAHACARIWAARGCQLFLVGRNPAKLTAVLQDLEVRAGATDRVRAQAADLDDVAAHEALIANAAAAMGGIDIALIAHGTLPDQAACAADPSRALREIHTNAVSVVSLATLLARGFEAQRAGQLAVIASVAGDRG